MPGNDADFAAYLAARWPAVVRTLVLTGCGRQEADEVARTGAAHCYRDWERVRRGDDVDAYVYGTVMARLHRRRRRVAAPAAEPPPDEATDEERLRVALVAQLERLDPDEREIAVLRFVAELSEAQIADVSGISLESAQARLTHGLGRLDLGALADVVPTGQQPISEIFRRASESIEVSTTPADEVVAEAQAQRRRRWRRFAAAAAAAVVVIAGLTWATNRGSSPSPSEDLAPAPVTRESNPVRVAWYADDELHLENVVVTVPALTDLVELNGGAVYGDREGTVAFVAADGQRRKIGDKSPDVPLVASTGDGWVAWVDPGSDGGQAPALVVYDVSSGQLLGVKEVSSGDVRPIAIDQHQVYYQESDGTFYWTPGDDPPLSVNGDGLLDVETANRVYQQGRRIEIVQSFFSVSFVRPGIGAQLSDAGILVLSKLPGPGVTEGGPFQPLLYDARSGDRKPSGVGPDERAVDATFGRNNTAVYLVAQAADLDGEADADPLLVLRACDLTSSRCTDVAPVQSVADRPILAH